MRITTLPTPAKLASMVSNVTETMCGISFEAALDGGPPSPALCFRLARLPIFGAHPLLVSLGSDEESCTALGAALFSCPPGSLEPSMIDDSLCELLNMAAGQIKSALALDESLGLPKILTGTELTAASERALREGTILRSRGALNLVLWISEGTS